MSSIAKTLLYGGVHRYRIVSAPAGTRLLSAANANVDKTPTVTMPDLADIVAEKHEMTKAESKRVLTTLFDSISEAVAAKKRVSIFGFGTFESVHRGARTIKNNLTKGEPLEIAAHERIRFKAYSALKELANKK